ncbi:MAG: hypothetical protein DWQ07_12815 [Chloroflexi bacterium]|nr:MAG: hypothetical protein DWQ07_12815 [Chloroflexota bacterium]MBL1196921.1 hypothetical protein [Chloroflexota bacterium]NOH14217.1 hypothetical protein [Chloroflexota bacterium]
MSPQLQGEFENSVTLQGEFKEDEPVIGESEDQVTAYYLAEEGAANRIVVEGGADFIVLERM